MASAVSSIYEYPISAASAAYAPTNTAEVTAMIDSAVSGKLDASASSAFITSTAGCQPAGDYVSSSELADYQTTAGMSAYATTAALGDKLDASASSAFITSTADCMPLSASSNYATTGDLSGKLDASAEVVTSINTTSIGAETFVNGINGNYLRGVFANMAVVDTNGRDLTSLADSSSLAEYQPTSSMSAYASTADLNGKLDASASSAFITSTANCQPSGDYVSSSDLSGYLPTSSIGVDSASAVTSIAGSSIAGGGAQVVTSITTGGYGVRAINNTDINASHMVFGAEAAADSNSDVVKLGKDYYGAGVYLTGSFGTAYYKVNELQLNRNSTGFIAFNIGGAGSQITATSNAGGKFSAGGTGSATSYYSAYNGNVTSNLIAQGKSAGMNLVAPSASASVLASGSKIAGASFSDGTNKAQIYVSGGSAYVRLNDASGTTGYIYPTSIDYWNGKADSSALADYQPTSSMSAYASTAELSAKLDASSIETSVDGVTGIGGTAIAGGGGGTTYSAGQYIQISSDEISVTGIDPASYAQSSSLADYQTTAAMSAYASTADLSAKLDASASSSFITSTADCMPLSASSNYATTGDLSAKLDASAETITSIENNGTSIYKLNGTNLWAEHAILDNNNRPLTSLAAASSLSAYQPTSSMGDYQTTAAMSGYATTGDLSAKLDSSASSSFLPESASSSFLTAQTNASWSETASGSPAYIEDKPDLVDIVAGPGIVVDNPDGNTLRVSMAADYEVTLFETTSTNGYGVLSGTLSEAYTNFEYIEIYGNRTGYNANGMNLPCHDRIYTLGSPTSFHLMSMLSEGGNANTFYPSEQFTLSSTAFAFKGGANYLACPTGMSVSVNNFNGIGVQRIVGINRISGGN